MWRTEKACESRARVIYGLLHVTSNCSVVQKWYLGYSWKTSAYILFAFVFHFIQHWCLNATCYIYQLHSWLIYKMLAFFSKSIYSYKDAGTITVCNAVCSAGFYKMESKLISAHITVWITRWMRCSMPYISLIEVHGCLAWVGTEWNLNASKFDPMALNDQQVSSESYRLLYASIYDIVLFILLMGQDVFHEHPLEIPGTLQLGQTSLSTKLYMISKLSAECWEKWWKNLPWIVIIICLYAQ